MVKRIQVAELLEKAMSESTWKGDSRTCGVFFTDEEGYCLNKILAVRINKIERAPDVFYSFCQPEEDKVSTSYPYENMTLKPKKHHLIIKENQIYKEHIRKMFDVDDFEVEHTLDVSDIIKAISSSVDNKREKDRCTLTLNYRENQVDLKVVKEKVKESTIYYEREICILYKKYTPLNVKVNAATILSVLRIFPPKTSVSFRLTRDRIKITGTNFKDSVVEIIVSQMK